MIKRFFQERRQKKEAAEASRQREEWLKSDYTQLLMARQRLTEYMLDPRNYRRVSEVQAVLLEANGGLVLGPFSQEGQQKSSSKER